MKKSNKFSPEVRERAVRMVQEHRGEYPSLWAAIESIAPKIGCVPQTLNEWVKRVEVDTRRGLVNEWLCANLASAFGLPIAPFALAEVPQELIEADLTGWLKDLGGGTVFASRKVMGQELAASQVPGVPLSLRRDVLVFDWWVRNNDRNLTTKGGNVNLLWQPGQLTRDDDGARLAEGGIAVIDHNLALDADFSASDFCQAHVFAGELPDTFSDFVLRQAFIQRLRQALEGWNAAWDNLSPAWGFVDEEQTMPSDYPKAEVRAMLDLIESPDFWNLPI